MLQAPLKPANLVVTYNQTYSTMAKTDAVSTQGSVIMATQNNGDAS